jgi:transposase
MSFHRNAKLGLAGRYALVSAIASGMTLKAAATAFNVSPATAHRWWHRWKNASEKGRATLSCLFDRSSRPHRSPRQLAPELAEAICACRRKTGWGPRLVAGATGFCHSTVWKVLRRAGVSRPPRAVREPANNAPSGTVTFDQYNGLYRALNAQLIGRGLRGQIHLMGGGLVESGGARHHYARMQYIAQNMGDVLGIRGYNTCGTRPACRRRTSCITATQTARTSGGRTSPASSSSGSTSTLHNWASPGRRSGMRTGRCTTGAAW